MSLRVLVDLPTCAPETPRTWAGPAAEALEPLRGIAEGSEPLDDSRGAVRRGGLCRSIRMANAG